jgi:quercetin dioxygenase-like cupin family protein
LGPFGIGPDEGRPIPHIGRVLASARQTSGAFELFELVDPETPPPHFHRLREEAFFVTEGRFTFVVGGIELDAPAGSFVFIPRGKRHAFGTTPGSKAMLLVSPAGLEGFFDELGRGLAAGRSPAELRAALAEGYDSTPL